MNRLSILLFRSRASACFGRTAALLAALSVLFALGCAANGGKAAPKPQFAGPVLAPPAVGEHLVSRQTPPSPEVERIARSLAGTKDVERLLSAMRHVGEHLAYDPAENPIQFDHTAPQVFERKTLGACSEFALATMALCRAMGYPSRLVVTMNAKWVERYRDNTLSIPFGHCFVESWAGGRWVLLDSTAFEVYDCGGRAIPYLPGNEIYILRADDLWEAGMTDVEAANAIMRCAAEAFEGAYVKPDCRVLGKVDFDYPTAFANLAQVFYDRGKMAMAKQLFRKSVELDPNTVRGLVGLGLCLLAEGDRDQAAARFAHALQVDPTCVQAKEGLDRLKAAPKAGPDSTPPKAPAATNGQDAAGGSPRAPQALKAKTVSSRSADR